VILFLDLETYSETPISYGTSRYAEGSEVLLPAFACDDDPVDVVEGWSPALTSLVGTADKIVVHGARFERTILKNQNVTLPVAKTHCTQAQARSVSLPGALGKLCDILGVPVDKAKDKQGKTLINLFTKPLPKNRKERRATKATHPVEWARFIDYAGLDVEAMREVYRRLPSWNYQGFERELWELDQKINDRGFAIDIDLSHAAISAVAIEQKRLGARTVELTDGDVESTTQRDQLLKHLLEECGVSLPDTRRSSPRTRSATAAAACGRAWVWVRQRPTSKPSQPARWSMRSPSSCLRRCGSRNRPGPTRRRSGRTCRTSKCSRSPARSPSARPRAATATPRYSRPTTKTCPGSSAT